MNTRCILNIKLSVIAIITLMSLVLAACGTAGTSEPTPPATVEGQTVEICVDEDTGTQMTHEEAVAIAEASLCVDQGPLLETHTCNGTTGTWWLDLDIDKPGCAPACVIDIVDGTVDINWRCTGALPEVSVAVPAADATVTATPDSESADSEPAATDWSKYTSQDDGFAFRYPPTWTIELLTDRQAGGDGTPAARAVMLTQDDLQLLIEFKRTDEVVTLGPDNLAAGTVEERGTVALFGRELPKHVLVEGEKDKAIFVGDRYPDLEVYIQLIAPDEISASAHAEFDQILATFTRTGTQSEQDAYPGWATYTSSDVAPGVGFTFRHRSDWTLTEVEAGTETPTGPSAAMAVLQRDAYVLRVQYKHVTDETTMVAAEFPDSLLMEAGTVWFMDRSVPRMVIVDDARLTHIFVSYADDTLLVSVDLSQDTTIVSEDSLDLPVEIRNEMDKILGSFKLVTP